MSFDLQKHYDEIYYKTMYRHNLIQFVLGSIALVSSWVGFHFFNWTVVNVGLMLLLSFLMFKTGGYDFIREQQNG